MNALTKIVKNREKKNAMSNKDLLFIPCFSLYSVLLSNFNSFLTTLVVLGFSIVFHPLRDYLTFQTLYKHIFHYIRYRVCVILTKDSIDPVSYTHLTLPTN